MDDEKSTIIFLNSETSDNRISPTEAVFNLNTRIVNKRCKIRCMGGGTLQTGSVIPILIRASFFPVDSYSSDTKALSGFIYVLPCGITVSATNSNIAGPEFIANIPSQLRIKLENGNDPAVAITNVTKFNLMFEIKYED